MKPADSTELRSRVEEQYRRRMEERGIRVGRPLPPLTTYNRLSLGLPQEMERFAEVLRDFRARGWV